jgi:putative ABC transport system permease protein
MAQGLKIVGIGMSLGIAVSLILAHLIDSLLYQICSTDPVAISISAMVLGMATFLACLLPAMRATRIDPIQALHE